MRCGCTYKTVGYENICELGGVKYSIPPNTIMANPDCTECHGKGVAFVTVWEALEECVEKLKTIKAEGCERLWRYRGAKFQTKKKDDSEWEEAEYFNISNSFQVKWDILD